MVVVRVASEKSGRCISSPSPPGSPGVGGVGMDRFKKKKRKKVGSVAFFSQQYAWTHRGGIFDEGKISLGSMFCFEIEKGGLTLLLLLLLLSIAIDRSIDTQKEKNLDRVCTTSKQTKKDLELNSGERTRRI